MKHLRDYRIFLVVWLSLGVLFGGYFLINPITYSHRIYPQNSFDSISESLNGPKYETTEGKHGEFILLIMLSGAILIGGIGYVKSKKNP